MCNYSTSISKINTLSEIELADNNGQYTSRNGVNDMTLICAKYDKNKIIIHADSLVTGKSGPKFCDKIFYQKDKPLIIAYSGYSEVVLSGKIIYVEKIISHNINNFTGENYESVKQTLIHDIGKFLPRDIDSFGQLTIGILNNNLQLEKIEVNAKAKTNIYNYSVSSIEDSNSYYFNENDIIISGNVNHNEIIKKYSYLDDDQEEKIHKIMQEYIKNEDYPEIGGYELSVSLDLDGNIIIKKYN